MGWNEDNQAPEEAPQLECCEAGCTDPGEMRYPLGKPYCSLHWAKILSERPTDERQKDSLAALKLASQGRFKAKDLIARLHEKHECPVGCPGPPNHGCEE